jgi:hypothetical protein
MKRGRSRRVELALVGALVGAAAVAGVGLPRVGHGSAQAPMPSRAARDLSVRAAFASLGELPASPKPAFRPARPTLLGGSKNETRWAPVIRTTVARTGPAVDAPPIATLGTTTPEGTTNIVVVTTEATRENTLWARVRLPVLPNGTLGWIPRSALGGYQFVATRLVIDRETLTATLYRNGRVVFRAPVGVGRSHWPTPAGTFYVREKLTKFASPFYGPLAFGTNARSAVLTDWPGGGFIGIHGTNEPDLLPGRVSHGCIRLRNADILRLARLMPVGTPVRIV